MSMHSFKEAVVQNATIHLRKSDARQSVKHSTNLKQ